MLSAGWGSPPAPSTSRIIPRRAALPTSCWSYSPTILTGSASSRTPIDSRRCGAVRRRRRLRPEAHRDPTAPLGPGSHAGPGGRGLDPRRLDPRTLLRRRLSLPRPGPRPFIGRDTRATRSHRELLPPGEPADLVLAGGEGERGIRARLSSARSRPVARGGAARGQDRAAPA